MLQVRLLTLFITILVATLNHVTSRTVFDNKFIEIRNKPTFVDKTLLIQEFLQHKNLFVNAPSKFGKSTNLDMISLFFGNHRGKKDIESTFIGTKIWNDKEFVKQHLGAHPVIHFNLKVGGYATDFEQTLTSFKVSLYNAFSDHMYLLESENMNEEQLSLLETYTDLTNCKLMDTTTVTKGLHFLANVLQLHHRKPVILLADEFGRGITEGIFQNRKDLGLIVELYSSILNETFSNESLISHTLLSGENWLYGVQSPAASKLEQVAFMQRVEFGTFYGFTYDEVRTLMNKFNISHHLEEVAFKWYGGYNSSDGLVKISNPFSIIQYLIHKTELVYWTGSALAPDLIDRMVGVDILKKHVINLVLRKTVVIDLGKDFKIDNVQLVANKVDQLPHYCENFFLRVLVEAGYLTFADTEGQTNCRSMKIANEEVQATMVKYTL